MYHLQMKLREKLQIIFSILLIVLIIICFQYQSLNLDMFWDDYGAFRLYSAKELIKGFYSDIHDLLPETSRSAYRPMFPIMFHFAQLICGFNSYRLHMMIIILQILQTVTAFIFFRMLTQNNSLALASSLLFPLNPNLWFHFTWNTEIPAMSGMFPFLLSLMSLISYIRNPKRIMIFFHCVFSILAYLTKETYIPLFLISILTIIYYREHNYKQYLPLVTWHMVIFVTYFTVRFSILKNGGGFFPAYYSGMELIKFLFWNYVKFLSQITLFIYYISSGAKNLILYLGITCIFLIAVQNILSNGQVNRKLLLYFILFIFLLHSLWLVKHGNDLPTLLQMDPWFEKAFKWDSSIIQFFLFLYSVELYVLIMFKWVHRKKTLKLDEQSVRHPSLLEETSKNQIEKLPNFSQKKLLKFFSYSFLFMLVSGLPMLYFPDGRIMNVTAFGMGGVFGSSFFIVLSMIGENSHKGFHLFSKKLLLRYTLIFTFILFVLNNSLIFKDKYMGPESFYNKTLNYDVQIYVDYYPYFNKYDLREQGSYLFNKLVSKGFVDRVTGRLIRDKVQYLGIARDELYDFKPPDAKIYPIIK